MAIIGFIASIVVLLYLSFAWGFWGMMILPKYNIGGVENSLGTKIFWVCVGVILFVLWRIALTNSPFSIIVS